jgi:hypothetical protein
VTPLVAYLLAAFGLAFIVGHSEISVGFRRFIGGRPARVTDDGGFVPGEPGRIGRPGEFLCALVECPACFGFWTGLLASLALGYSAVLAVAAGCMTSGSNFVLARLTKL